MKKKLLLYIIIINIFPFLLYDRFYLDLVNRIPRYTYVFAVTHFLITKILVFVLIYILIQKMLIKFIMKNLFNKNFVSNYVHNEEPQNVIVNSGTRKEFITMNQLIVISIITLFIVNFVLANQEFIHYFTETYNTKIFISFFINVLIYKYYIKKKVLETLYLETQYKVKKHIATLFYILVVGSIGTKKSTNVVALAQMTERCKINDMTEKQYRSILLLMKHINFSELDMYIEDNFNQELVYTDEMYLEFAEQYLKDTNKEHLIEELQEVIRVEKFRHITSLKLLSEYIELYYYLNYRKRHIISNTTIESINTGLNAIIIKESLDQLYRTNDLANEKFLTKVYDEYAIVDNARVYNGNTYNERKENDDGKDVNAMIQRHGSKGTTTTFLIAQSEKDVTASRRRLPNRIVEFLIPKEVYIYEFEIRIIDLFIMYLRNKESKKYSKKMNKMNKLVRKYNSKLKQKYLDQAEKLHNKYGDYLQRINGYKKVLSTLFKINMYLQRDQYNIQYSFLHESIERVGKTGNSETHIASSMPIIFVYPVNITYEKYDQFAFYGIYNERNKSATTPLSKVKSFESKIMTRKDFETMNFRGINKILKSIDKQNARNKNDVVLDPSEF